MGLEPSFPFEFVVEGVPVSLSNKNKRGARDEWEALVRASYKDQLPEGHWATTESIFVTILYFTDSPMQGDIDNIVKPMLDIMTASIYVDDRQVERVIVQKFEPGRLFSFDNPSATLAEALELERPVVYVRLDTDDSVQEIWQ
jgi:hypothetical protein